MLKRFLFIQNAVLLTVTSLVLRSAGMFYRVYLSGELGAEGMGLYQMVFAIHLFAATLATSGLSVAVTRLVSQSMASSPRVTVRPIVTKALRWSFFVSITVACTLYVGAGWVSFVWLKDERALFSVRTISFALPFMSMSACLHGYFVARRRIRGTTASQLLEQGIRMGLTFMLLEWGSMYGVAFACFAVVVGNVVAEMCSWAYLYICFVRDQKRLSKHMNQPAKSALLLPQLLAIALPIAGTGGLGSLLRTIENVLVPDCLTRFSGLRAHALEQVGVLKGMAMPVLFFPSAFLGSLSMLLLPEISEAHSLGHKRQLGRTVGSALHITLTGSILIAAWFFVYANDLGMLLYRNTQVGRYLLFFVPLVPVMYLESITDGILKGLGQQMSTFRYSMLDSLLRISITVWLVPRAGMAGFLVIMACSNMLTSYLNIRRLLTVMSLRMRWGKWVLKPLLAAAVCCVVVRLVFVASPPFPPAVSMAIGCALMSVVYGLCLLLIGGITKQEMLHLFGR